jgi:hypothetical protein
MRLSHAAAVIAAAFALEAPGLAQAQSVPNQLLSGEVQQAIGYLGLQASCYVNRGFSSFQRNGDNSKAVISFSEITAAGFDLAGSAIMTFTSPTSGNLHFKITPGLPPGEVNPPFANFSQSYNASTLQLVVSFTINFGDCSLPITAVYELT